MKRIILVIVLLLAILYSGMSFGLSAVTKGNNIACITEQLLKNVISLSMEGDTNSIRYYIRTGKCVVLKSGIKVVVTKSPGLFGSTAKFIYKGFGYWTVREALKYNNRKP